MKVNTIVLSGSCSHNLDQKQAVSSIFSWSLVKKFISA
jgi:hypothetical protein